MRAVNPIRATGLQYYFEVMRLKLLPDLTLRQPSPGKVLQQFTDPLLPATASSWIHITRITKMPLDLEFLADLTAKLNELRRGKTAMWRTRLVLSAHLGSNSIRGFLSRETRTFRRSCGETFTHLCPPRYLPGTLRNSFLPADTATLLTAGSFRRHFPP